MRRSRRSRRNDNQIIEAIKWYQGRIFRTMLFGLLPLALLFAGFAWWLDTPAGARFMGWEQNDAKWEKRIKNHEKDMQKKYESFEESTNQDVQNTIDNIEGATEDTTGAEYYSEDPYTAPETQESAEQPTEQTNGANNSVSEKPKKTVESYDTTNEPQAEAPQDNLPDPVPDESKTLPGAGVEYDEEGNPITEEEE